MAYLLGSRYCVESLSSDVKDLQEAVVDVASRVGPVRYPSWKFPDKISSEVDISDLLEDCVYSEEDEEDNQVAHIKLIEMVVDSQRVIEEWNSLPEEVVLAETLLSFEKSIDPIMKRQGGLYIYKPETGFLPDTQHPPTTEVADGVTGESRMVLLLQSFTRFSDQMLSKTAGRPPSASPKTVGSNMSIGMVVKKFWIKMVQLNVLLQQLHSENRSKTQSVNKLEIINKELQHQTRGPTGSAAGPLQQTLSPRPPTEHASEPPDTPITGRISADVRSVAAQTLETSFVPCDACYQVQLSFRSLRRPSVISRHQQAAITAGEVMTAVDIIRDVENMVVGICNAQGLSSAVSRHQKQAAAAAGEVMTAADIIRWRKEGEKDLNRIRSHLSSLMAQIDPLKLGLDETKKSCKELTKNLSEKTTQLSKERDERETKVAQYELQIRSIEQRHKESLATVKKSYDDLTRYKTKADQETVRLKQELLKQCDALTELDALKQQLQETLAESSSRKNLILRLESDVEQMTQQLKATQTEVQEVNRKLGKEQAKNRSIEKQGQSMQVKHDILTQRVDELDQESQELRDQLAEVEDSRDETAKDLEQARREMNELEKGLQKEKELAESIQSEKRFLEESISDLKTIILSLEDEVKVSQERERLLVQYPERNPSLVPNPPKTGVDEEDMKSQVQANSIRMQVLEEENNLLRKNISKLLDGREEPMVRGGVPIDGPAIPLWQSSGLDDRSKGRPLSGASSRTQQGSAVVSGRFNDPVERVTSSKARKHNQRHEANLNIAKDARRQPGAKENSSLQAYSRLKKAGSLNSGTGDTKGKHSATELKPPRPRPGWASAQSKRSSTADSYTKQDMFMCPNCDKMYPTQRDIDIHSSYCYG